MVKCPNCGKEITNGKFCSNCGTPIPEINIDLVDENNSNSGFCGNCGAKLKPNAKLSDIIDISKMKNLKRFAYKDNSVSLIFDKDPIRSMYNCEPEPFDIETHQKTKDGYYVYLQYDR